MQHSTDISRSKMFPNNWSTLTYFIYELKTILALLGFKIFLSSNWRLLYATEFWRISKPHALGLNSAIGAIRIVLIGPCQLGFIDTDDTSLPLLNIIQTPIIFMSFWNQKLFSLAIFMYYLEIVILLVLVLVRSVVME